MVMRSLGLLAGALLLAACQVEKPVAAKKAPAVPVVVAPVIEKTVPVEAKVIGNVEPYATVAIKSRVGGELTKVHFREGDFVKAGDLLFEIDSRPYQSAVNRAEANLARELAMLKQHEANLARDIAQEAYPKSQAARYEKLFKEGIFAREQYDQVRAQAEALAQAVLADRAAIESSRESIRAARGALDGARLELSFCTIRSPISGRTGSLAIDQGTIVKANDVDLVTIHQVQPIYVSFAVPESRLPEIKRRMAAGRLAVTATNPSDESETETGTLTFVDNAVDANTGTIRLKGTFANPARRLWPGQFVNVAVRLSTVENARVVPSQAVQTGQQGEYVFVVKADRTVEVRNVTTGVRHGLETVIARGLDPGESVVTDGQLRLAPGTLVEVTGGAR